MHLGDEEQIYSIVFDSLAESNIRVETEWLEYLRTRHCFKDSTWRQCCDHVADSVRALPDSLVARVYIVDTTMSGSLWFCPATEEWQRQATAVLFRDVDDAYRALLCIADSLTRTSVPFPAQRIHSRYGYRLIPLHRGIHGVRGAEEDILRRFTFSRIGFDAERTKACVVTDYWCGGLCASGDFWFLEKIGIQWMLVRRVIGVQS
jgi:hypothetical protein